MRSTLEKASPDAECLKRKKGNLSKASLATLIVFIVMFEGLGYKNRFTWTLFLLAGVFFVAFDVWAFLEGRKAERMRRQDELKMAKSLADEGHANGKDLP